MKILITGGAGFIGSHISKLLLDQGHNVLIYDNLSRGFLDNIDKRALFLEGDLHEQQKLEKSLKGVDWVIHMAALAEVAESVQKPLKYAENNIVGTIHLLEAMKNSGVRKIVFSSSCVVYGKPEKLPLSEDSAIMAFNPYGATKVANESFLASYHSIHGFDVVMLRYFNPYGPGEKHDPETHAIPNFIKAGLSKKPLPLYWKGEIIRDFIYVEDLARAHIAPLKLSGLHVFNVGTEKGTKVIDIINHISNILEYKLEINDLGERLGDVPALFASSAKLKKMTGWKPQVGLKEGLTKTIEWFRENKTLE